MFGWDVVGMSPVGEFRGKLEHFWTQRGEYSLRPHRGCNRPVRRTRHGLQVRSHSRNGLAVVVVPQILYERNMRDPKAEQEASAGLLAESLLRRCGGQSVPGIDVGYAT